jgi:hypothetical protein
LYKLQRSDRGVLRRETPWSGNLEGCGIAIAVGCSKELQELQGKIYGDRESTLAPFSPISSFSMLQYHYVFDVYRNDRLAV